MKKSNPDKPLVWVDIGGGTGMSRLLSIDAEFTEDLSQDSISRK
jgi:hypothetical protein